MTRTIRAPYGMQCRKEIMGFLRIRCRKVGPNPSENPFVQGYLAHQKTPTPLGPP